MTRGRGADEEKGEHNVECKEPREEVSPERTGAQGVPYAGEEYDGT